MFSYLYNTISSEIKSGKYLHGEKLPSYKQVCAIYEVGIRTVKDVFAALQRDGYIKTEERKRAVVMYRQERRPDDEYLKELLIRRDAIVDSLHAVKPLLCDLIIQSMAVNGSFELAQCRKIIRGISDRPIYERWRAVSNMLKRLLVNFNNPLVVEIYADFDLYINTTSFEGFSNPYELICDDIEKVFTEFLNDYEKGNVEYVNKCINNILERTAAELEKYLAVLAKEYPKLAALPQREFEWLPQKRRAYAHTEIARSIIGDLGAGVFDMTANMLPSIAALAKRYAVSTYTIKEALCALEGLGLVEIVNGVGTRVTTGNVKSHAKDLKNSILKNDCMTLLYGVQFFALTGRCAAALAFDNIDVERLRKEGAEVNEKSVDIPTVLIDSFVDGLPYRMQKVIYNGIRGLLNWGYYFNFLLNESGNGDMLNKLSKRAMRLPAQGDKREFADTFGDIWIFNLNVVSVNLARLGITDAEKVYIPQYNSLGHIDISVPQRYY